MFLWDYGSLSEGEESKIILKIVSSINQHPNLRGDPVNEKNLAHIA